MSDSKFPAPPGFELVEDVNERTQKGDLYFDDEDGHWIGVPWARTGAYVTQFYAVARKAPEQPKPFVRRIRRTRKPKE